MGRVGGGSGRTFTKVSWQLRPQTGEPGVSVIALGVTHLPRCTVFFGGKVNRTHKRWGVDEGGGRGIRGHFWTSVWPMKSTVVSPAGMRGLSCWVNGVTSVLQTRRLRLSTHDPKACVPGGRIPWVCSVIQRKNICAKTTASSLRVRLSVYCSLAKEGVRSNSPVFSSLPLACPPMKRRGHRGHWGERWQTEADSVTKSPDGATQMLITDGTAVTTSSPGQMQDERRSLVFRLRSSELWLWTAPAS